MTISILIALLVLWMLACVWCGFGRRYRTFGLLLGGALAANIVWMVTGLKADPLSGHALVAHLAAIMYAASSFVIGWIAGRFYRSWQGSRVEQS